MLQILEDGKITDSHGKKVSFENTVIVMTTNCGSDYKGVAPGYTASAEDARSEKVLKSLREYFRPEFLNRIDEIAVFNPLDKDTLREILKKLVGEFADALKERGIELEISDDAIEILLSMGLDMKNGARPLRRVIQKNLEDKAAEKMIGGALSGGQTFSVFAECGKLCHTVK